MSRPSTTSDEAEEGTAIHWVGSEVLESYTTDGNLKTAGEYLDKMASNGVLITDEMIQVANEYIQYILKRCQRTGHLNKLEVEKKVAIDRIYPGISGTPDCALFLPGPMELFIDDLKSGRKPVEHVDNWQLAAYAIGKLDEITGGNGLFDQQITVHMTIIQPRAFHPEGTIRTWTVNGADLRSMANIMHGAVNDALSDNPPTQAGPWCHRCDGIVNCYTNQKAAAGVTDRIEVLQLNDLTPHERSVELGYLETAKAILDARLEALEAEALQQHEDGVITPGYGIGTGRGSKVWVGTPAEVIAFGDLIGTDLRKPEAPVTPTQAINDKKVDAAVIEAYSKKIPGKKRLVKCKDTTAARLFRQNPIKEIEQ